MSNAFDETDVLKAFRAVLVEVAGVPPSSRIGWYGRTFNPPDLATGVSEQELWLTEEMRVLDESTPANCTRQAIGETIYSVYTPSGRGTEEANALAKAIADAFIELRSLSGDVEAVILERTERRQFVVDPNRPAWMYKPVVVRWRVFTTIIDAP